MTLQQKMIDNGHLFTDAHNFFHKTFHEIKFHTFQDFELSVLFCKPVIDIHKFDKWLHIRFGDYESEGLSMQDVLTNNYGENVALYIKGLLA